MKSMIGGMVASPTPIGSTCVDSISRSSTPIPASDFDSAAAAIQPAVPPPMIARLRMRLSFMYCLEYHNNVIPTALHALEDEDRSGPSAQPANSRYVSVIHTMAQVRSASMTAALP